MPITNIDNAFITVSSLIKDFEKDREYYSSTRYSEAAVRQDFIDKFFTALGWDVNHDYQKNPFKQEVKVEKTQKQEDSNTSKRADYAFYIEPEFRIPKFFVEAKKPSRTLRQNKKDYFQTARYGWNAQTGVAILTDFEEFVVIDCRLKPDIDTVVKNEISYHRYTDFKDKDTFSEIYWLFSREALLAGNLATYIENLPSPKSKARQLQLLSGAYQDIDTSFLNYIDDIRLQMAIAFHSTNPDLTGYELTEATQRTIDRLVFMRFLEDKQIEAESILLGIANSKNSWAKFVAECKRLDVIYNGIIFKPHFIDDKDFNGAEAVRFKEIATDFDPTNSPYNFNYIPIHILGNIYERFLGKIIDVHDGKVVIEQKPEVRRAGGVYYTPKYVVDDIVEHTVGFRIRGKSLKAINDLKIADISCGSGSFLISVYDYLLNYYKIYYNDNPTVAKEARCIYDEENSVWGLSIWQKQQILLRHVYGVDIDQQAVEVTQLSLFLKLLEDEDMLTKQEMQILFADKILPDLTSNIVCGNSLVDYSIMENTDLDQQALRMINPFDFQYAFPAVFKRDNSGFDILVGNPPYLKEYTYREVFEIVKQTNLGKYYQGKMDLWYFFIAHGLDLLRDDGLLGYIAPNNWVSNAGASGLRNKVISDSQILRLVDFAGFMVFDEADIQTMIIVLQKTIKLKSYSFFYQVFDSMQTLNHQNVSNELKEVTNLSQTLKPKVVRKQMIDSYLKFNDVGLDIVLDKIAMSGNFRLDGRKEVAQGVVPNPDVLTKKAYEKYYLNHSYKVGEPVFVIPKGFFGDDLSEVEKSFIQPLYEPYELDRFYFPEINVKEIIYLTKHNEKPSIEKLISHLQRFKEVTNERRETKKGSIKNYHLHWPRDERFFSEGEKIIAVRKCVNHPVFSYTDEKCFVMMSCNIIKTDRIDLKYLTGLLNSKLVEFWLRHRGKMQGDNFQVDKEPLLEIPIVDTDNTEWKRKIIVYVEQLSQTITKSKSAKTDKDKSLYDRRINQLENELNQTVYAVYKLETDDIKMIEDNNKV